MSHIMKICIPLMAIFAMAWTSLGLAAEVSNKVEVSNNFPNRPIKVLVGFPPGGGVDLTARLMAQALSVQLGQPVVVENKAGAAGAIAAELAARATPDGYTLVLGNTGSMTINPALYSKLPYNTLKDFEAVAGVSKSPMLVMVNPNSAYKTVADFKSGALIKPGVVSFGSGGTGSIGHLIGELMAMHLGVKLLHVPYKGGTPAIADLLGSQVDMVVEGVPLSGPLIRSGKIKALFVTAGQRLDVLPDVPSAVEVGLPDLNLNVWYGFLAPAGTPTAVVKFLNDAVNAVLKDPEVIAKINEQGAVPMPGTPADFKVLLAQELARWQQAVKAGGIEVQ